MIFALLSSVLAAAILSNILTQGIGLENLTKEEFRVKPVLKTTTVVSVAALLIFIIDYLIYNVVLLPLEATYLNIFVLVILMIILNELYQILVSKLKFELPKGETIILNSVVILVGLLGLTSLSFELAFIQIVGSLLGFIAMTILLTMNVSRMRVAPMIKSFKGLPIVLIVLGLIILVLTGLGGIF